MPTLNSVQSKAAWISAPNSGRAYQPIGAKAQAWLAQSRGRQSYTNVECGSHAAALWGAEHRAKIPNPSRCPVECA